MKRTIQTFFIASFLSLPLFAHVTNASAETTCAEVRAELVAAELAGQYPQSDAHYPDAAPDVTLMHAAQRTAVQAAVKAVNDTSHGHSISGSIAADIR